MGPAETTDVRHSEAPPAPASRRPRHSLSWAGVVVLAASAVVGSNMFAVRDHLFGTVTPNRAAPAAGRVAGDSTDDTVAAAPVPPAPTSLRSQPWWQDVTTLQGTGSTTASTFTIAAGAIQWRVKWTCQSGRLQVRVPKQAKPVVDGACPQGADGYSSQTGPQVAQVTADGPWRLDVAQQIDVPLVEPPLPAMTAGATTVGAGSFYNIDKTGMGRVTLYRQADGKYSIRLDDFFVSPNTDLELWLSTLDAPRSSQEFSNARSELVAVMDVTAGSLNYAVPAGLDPTKFKSVVVWCSPVSSAYAAASLVGAR